MDRRTAVVDLIELRRPLEEAIETLRTFPWDSDEELATLGPSQLSHILNLFLAGKLSAQELEDWANAVEGRDDISFTPPALIDFVAEVANPLLHRPLVPETIDDLKRRVMATRE